MTALQTEKPKQVACVLVIARPLPALPPVMLLLQRRQTDSYPLAWCIPGGKVEQDENVLQAAVRELQEETGVECTTGDIDRCVNLGVPGYKFFVCVIFHDGNLPKTTVPEGNPGLGWFSVFDPPPCPNITPLHWSVLEEVREIVSSHYKD